MYKAIRLISLLVFFFCALTALPAAAEVVVQVMSVQDEAAAQKEADRLFNLGVPAFSRGEEVPDKGLWHRVYVGPFETSGDAKVAAETLKKQGVIKDFVVRTSPPATAATAPAEGAAPVADPAPGVAAAPGPTADPEEGGVVFGGSDEPEPRLPVAQTPTYGEPVSPEQARELGLSGPVGPTPARDEEMPLAPGVAPAPGAAAPAPGAAEPPAGGLQTYGQGGTSAPAGTLPPPDERGLPPGFKAGDDMPGLAPSSSLSPDRAPLPAPSAGDDDSAAPIMVAQTRLGAQNADQDFQEYSAAVPGNLSGFTCLVDLSSSMRRLVDCQARMKEEAVAGLLRKMNHRIPNKPYNATLRVFGYKIAVTRRDFTTTYYGPATYDRNGFEDAIARLVAADSVSPFATAMDTADSELSGMGDPKAILMFSDFEESAGSGAPIKSAQNLRRRYGQNLKVYTFYVTRQNSAVQLAKDIADAGGGRAFNICQMLDNEAAFEAMMMEIFGPADTAPCADSDRDGVCDEDDICPNTPPGVPVDDRGCWIAAYEQFFDFDKAVVKPAFMPRIRHAAEVIKSHPELNRIIIAGHTDNKGTPEYNQNLGLRRAQAVHDLLIKEGVPASRLGVESYGETRPIVSNDTEEGRARNRRVEFHVGEVPRASARP